jgi:hypothetical protein
MLTKQFLCKRDVLGKRFPHSFIPPPPPPPPLSVVGVSNNKCDTYQCNKVDTIKPLGTLQSLPVRPTIWTDISMYFIVGLPKLGNNLVILVVLSQSRFQIHSLLFSSTPITTFTVAQFFIANIFKLHGIPHSIVYDRHLTFSSNFWQELFRL